MSVVQNLPASNTPFTVEKYKRDLPTLRYTFGFVPKMILRVLTMSPAAIVKMTCLPNMHLKLAIIVPMWLVMCRC